ncbi:hypothetical protein HW555_002105 [Spodoptera exigua]|uniref:Centrosomal protein of 97 kDa n=1 Tax=Spodoptera exigua TaxID=7107 RepID=A0A835LAH2_SPOEX|nr:hypothetical protein HW555_002105 [Spodoptera exigua]
MEEVKNETVDLSRRGLKKIEKAPAEESKTIINLILDQNELQRLDNIDTYNRVENLSICNNFLLRMHGVSRLTNIRILALNNNGILQIEGLKDLIYLKVLKLAGNNIKSIEHLNHNMHLEHLDLSNNQISFIADISYLKSLKHLNLERNRISDLRQCDRYLPSHLEHLGLAHNSIQDLNEISHLVHLNKLESFSIQGNPCVAMAGKDKLGFDYRPFVLNWIMSVKSIDGFVVSAIESLKAEWLYSQGKGRHFHAGQHQELCEYLASTCPLTADALETEDQRKLRLILSKQQLKDQTHSPLKPKLQSPRMQSRISTPRHMGRSPDRLTSSYHAALTKSSSPSHQMSSSLCGDLPGIPTAMSQSFDSPGIMYATEKRDGTREKEKEKVQEIPQPKPVNHSLEAASKMVPVPESLMSPDYQDPIYDIQRSIPKPSNNSVHSVSNTSSQSSNSSIHEDKPRHAKNMKGSPKLPKSATSSPKLKTRMEQRKGSLSKIEVKNEEKKLNGITNESEQVGADMMKLPSNQRRQKKMSVESMAAVTIQKMWRGYRSRNLNKDTLRILHAIQAARARQHIQKYIIINNNQKQRLSESDDNTDALRQLSETCFSLQAQVAELQGCMQEVLKAVSTKNHAEPVGTQTDITAVITPQEERCTWLRRPQSLSLSGARDPPVVVPVPHREQSEKSNETAALGIERTESVIEEQTAETNEVDVDPRERDVIAD